MLRVQTFGNSVIDVGDWHLKPTAARAFALLLYLATERGRRVPRSVVLALIFGDQSEPNASHSLRQLLYKLRQSGAVLESNADEIALATDEVVLDYVALLSAERLTSDQLELIRGGFLPDFAPTLTEAYAEWLDAFRASTTLDLRRVLVRELSRARSVADWRAGERAARACLALDPLNEEATLGLAEALAAAGSKAEAVELLDRYLAEMGPGGGDLRLPATLLRRRISERVALPYRSQPELPFVGREREMLLLGDRFQRARAGESQCVVLHGEAGIGKSRLAAEFATVAALDGARVVRVVAQPHDVHRPMGAFVDLVPLLLELPGALGCSPESMAALKRLTKHGSVDGTATLDPADGAVFHGITRSISDLVDAVAAEVPILLAIEDAHWMDMMSVLLIARLSSEQAWRRLLVVVTSREALRFEPQSTHADRITLASIGGISATAAAELVKAAVAGTPAADDTPLQQWMISLAGGNPLFASAVTLHYVTTRERFAVSPTLSALLGKRLSCIDQRAFALLQVCVVLGKHCTLDRLAGTLSTNALDLIEGLQAAASARLIVAQGNSISVAHVLIAEAVTGLSSEPVLKFIHRRVAELLESEAATSASAALLWDAAEHWATANESQRALILFRRCAEHAAGIGRPREAAQVFRRILDLPLSDDERKSVAIDLVSAADAASDFPLVMEGIGICRPHGQVTHDTSELCELRALADIAGDAAHTRRRILDCISANEASAEHRLRAATLALIVAHNDGDKGLADMTRAALSPSVASSDLTADQLEFLLIYHTAFGQLDEASLLALRLNELSQDWAPARAVRAQLNASRALWMAGCADQAIATLNIAHANCAGVDLARSRLMVVSRLATYSIDNGDATGACEWIARAAAMAADDDESFGVSDYATLRIQHALATRNLDDAESSIRRSLGATGADRSGHTDRWFRALRLRFDQLASGNHLPHSAIAELTKRALNPVRHEVSDLEMAIALNGLFAAEQTDGARQLLESYLSRHRQIRSPLARELSDCVGLLSMGLKQPDERGLTPTGFYLARAVRPVTTSA